MTSHRAPEDPQRQLVEVPAPAALAANVETDGDRGLETLVEAGVAAVHAVVDAGEDGYVSRHGSDVEAEDLGHVGSHRTPEETRYAGRRRRYDDDDAEPASMSAASEIVAEVILMDPIPEDILAGLRTDLVREHISKPQLTDIKTEIRQKPEPDGGYLTAYLESVGRAGVRAGRAMDNAARAAALAKQPADRTDFDDYMLGTNPDTRAESRDPSRIYYGANRALADLQEGRMPTDFRDVESLELAVAAFIEDGLGALQGNQGFRRSLSLDVAADLIREATLRVPGFNPVRAGLNRLYSESLWMNAALQTEGYHWAVSRKERATTPDHMAEMCLHALEASEDIIAALYLQQRESLLAPAEESAAV